MTHASNTPPLADIVAVNEALRRSQPANVPPVDPERLSMQVVDAARMPSAEQLAKPHQRVTLKNTSEVGQIFYVQDRAFNQVRLLPGHPTEVDLLCTQIANLAHLARGDRGFYPAGSPKAGQPFEPHPIRIIGLGPKQINTPQAV
jgi:hypothetical protein